MKKLVVILFSMIFMFGCTSNKQNESNEFEFVSKNVDGVVEECGYTEDINTINLSITDGTYFTVNLPSHLDYVTDYSKYLYTEDGSVAITVISGVTLSNLSSMSAISNYESFSKDTIYCVSNEDGPQEVARYLTGDKAIVVRVYGDCEAYATIFKSVVENNVNGFVNNRMYALEDFTKLESEVPVYNDYTPTYIPNMDDITIRKYIFDDGFLIQSRDLKRVDDARDFVSSKMMLANEFDYIAELIVQTDTIYYAELNDFTVATYQLNLNTALTMFGKGIEARNNISAFIREYSNK